jgi:hypothetical protein
MIKNKSKFNKKILIISFLLLNLIFSIKVMAAHNLGVQTIAPCTTNCFGITTTDNLIYFEDHADLTRHTFFISNDPKVIYFISDSNSLISSGEYLIYDLRDNGGLKLSVTATNFHSVNHPENFIPYTNLGIFSFNKTSGTSIDTTQDKNFTSLIDPVEKGAVSNSQEPYDFSKFVANPVVPSSFSNFFAKFNGSDPNVSDPITISEAPLPVGQGRVGLYRFGLGGYIQIPSDVITNNHFTDDTYQSTLTFTLENV